MKELKMGCSKSMDDFSFPIITNPFSNLTIPPYSSSSSSLWRVSSRVYHHEEEEEEEEEEGRMMEVRSMCEEGISPMMMSKAETNIECVSCQDEEWEAEDRMDYLWEDFNHEEEKRESKRIGSKEVCIVKKQRSNNKVGRSHQRSSSSSRRSSILVMGKLLKGLLSIKKSAQAKIMKTRF